ncbi:uncharacterized protein TrAtP1_008339 [Trichoderma atroviride]|uniref:uncharacterized protein n=1 Tax=Hypocrea atroviridis TaxID=63577 RepID=UPI003322D1EB|nr:hypothetical protein TrAtP1_008339 [Trichoderma atroviride]
MHAIHVLRPKSNTERECHHLSASSTWLLFFKTSTRVNDYSNPLGSNENGTSRIINEGDWQKMVVQYQTRPWILSMTSWDPSI